MMVLPRSSSSSLLFSDLCSSSGISPKIGILVGKRAGLEVVIRLDFHLYALSYCFFSNGLVPLEKADSHVEPLSGAQRHPWWLKIQEKKIKKSSNMNVDHLKAVGNGYSSSNSSSSIPYLANRGIPSLKLPAVVNNYYRKISDILAVDDGNCDDILR
ncbi:hypothetical protein Ahy_B03g061758 isoform A [Arachis hypogaea]|uniref:Uncharacterized protein n=1 Tax=Arachis hypogaea TaxID=3818 RepID=A0A444ZRS6_ARAHY|nr:hypothetical protein Ahy_B03g061758 isoform A [Arachis hypogaea]